MGNGPFIKHDNDTIPLDCSTVPLPECMVRPALKDGNVINVVDVPILSCASVWLRCQKEAEKWVTDTSTGKLLANSLAINRRINSAYAFLWLSDHRFQWAGLAAFASKQVGCGLLNAAATVKRMDDHMLKNTGQGSDEFLFNNVNQLGVAVGAEHMEKQLALGNLTLFLDIYPLHRFYMLRGIDGMRKCLNDREKIKDMVYWPEKAKEKLPFGRAFAEIRRGFEAIDANDLVGSVKQLARHEQLNVLQQVIYSDQMTRMALDGNQFAWVTKLPTGDYADVQLTLSAQCAATPTMTSWFKKSMDVHLYNETDRMEFVFRAAEQFDKLLRSKRRADVERSIRQIYAGGGLQ
jgi:hypothetical protein